MGVTSVQQNSMANQTKYNRMSAKFGHPPYECQYVVIAGGGGAGTNNYAGGGGGGGYLSSVIADNQSGEPNATGPARALKVVPGSSFTVSVGAGGASTTQGSPSQLGADIVADGGGRGVNTGNGSAGGSGGGGGYGTNSGGNGNQGFFGGQARVTNNNDRSGGGGGGAGDRGREWNTVGTPWSDLAPGLSNSFATGSSVQYSQGGTGGLSNYPNIIGVVGPANTGQGGGKPYGGGSGIVAIAFPKQATVTVGAGLTYSTRTWEDNTLYVVYTFTAGEDTVTVS